MNKEYNKTNKYDKDVPEQALKFDALTAGMENGGLRSVMSINMLVCYLVANLNNKVTAQIIINAIDEGMIANHFEISSAVDRMIKSGTVIQNEDGTLSMTESNSSNIELIEKDLPYTIRKKSIHLCQKIIATETYKRENKVDIEKLEKGYEVTLRVSDVDTDFMTLKLFSPTEDQAILIRDKFISNPVAVYNKMIESIFKNEE